MTLLLVSECTHQESVTDCGQALVHGPHYSESQGTRVGATLASKGGTRNQQLESYPTVFFSLCVSFPLGHAAVISGHHRLFCHCPDIDANVQGPIISMSLYSS